MRLNDEAFISSELSTLEESLRKANELKEYAAEATASILASWNSLNYARTNDFEQIKKLLIEQMRSARTTVEREALQTLELINKVKAAANGIDTKKLDEFVKACSKLEELRKSGFFEIFKSTKEQ